MRELSLCLLIFQIFLISTALAESPYLCNISKSHIETENVDSSLFLPIKSWVGERFVFLPKQTTFQRFGYQDFHIDDDLYKHPTYNEYVGRIAKVVSSKKVYNHWDVELEMEDNGQKVSATARFGDIKGIALVADILGAHNRWLAKTLWFRKTWIDIYDEDTGEISSFHIEKNTRVNVINIMPGWNHRTPVRFVLQTPTGKLGYVDIAWSGTNCCEYERKYYDSFEASFFTQDPTKSNKPSKKTDVTENIYHHKAVNFSYDRDYGENRYSAEKKLKSSKLRL